MRQLAGARRHVAPTRFPTGLKAEQMTAHKDAYDANARLNDARARMELAASEADHDQLLAALDGVRDTLEDQRLDPALALLAARNLVERGEHARPRSHGRTRYAAAVSLYGRLAQENPAFDWAQIATHEQLADYQAFEMMLAGKDFKAARLADDEDAMSQAFSRLLDTYHSVEHELTVAIHLTKEDAEILPQYMCQLGIHLCLSSSLLDEDRTDDGISVIRSALTLRSARQGGTTPVRGADASHQPARPLPAPCG